MKRTEIFERVKEVLGGIAACEEEFSEEDLLKEELGLDSLSLVNVIVELENAFGLTFDDADLDPSVLVDVRSLVDLVQKS